MVRAAQLGSVVPPCGDVLVIPDVPRGAGCHETYHPDRINYLNPQYGVERSDFAWLRK